MIISFRNVCASLFANMLLATGVVRFFKNKLIKSETILSIYFHKPTRDEFEACIKWLIKNKFSFLSLNDLKDIISSNKPFPKGSVLITVDDGWSTNDENIVSLADKYEIPVAIFISSEPIEQGVFWWSYINEAKRNKLNCLSVGDLKRIPDKERIAIVDKIKRNVHLKREALTISQLTEISKSKYITIGGHTHSHPILTNCNDDQVISEIIVSKNKIENWIGTNVSTFAYPNGDYGCREQKVLQMLNFDLAFCCNAQYLTSKNLKNLYELPRFSFREGASEAENLCRIIGIWQPMIKWLKHPFNDSEKIKNRNNIFDKYHA